ncbi:hypothetical protein ACU4GR_00810 [Methylobacterium oryzae CBMB20]
MSGVAVVPATAALLVLCMALWATALLPEIVTALAFFGLAMLLRLGSAGTVFSGFSASAFWLVLSGMVVGQGMTRTGLGARMARTLALRLSGFLRAFHRRAGGAELPHRLRHAVESRADRADDPGDPGAVRRLRTHASAARAEPARSSPVGRGDADPVGRDPARQRARTS